jgi:hypothetical protein
MSKFCAFIGAIVVGAAIGYWFVSSQWHPLEAPKEGLQNGIIFGGLIGGLCGAFAAGQATKD